MAMDDEKIQRKLAAIFHADVVGYSKLMRDDEMATVNTISEYRELMTTLIRQHRGRVVDTSGDNILAEFPSVVDAMQSAVSAQKELRSHNANLPEHRWMQFRIGINIGDVIQEGDRIYGDGVNIAARLETLAEPGGICISRMAYDQIESKLPLGYEYLGEHVLKNIGKPLHAYRVVMEEDNRSRQKKKTEGSDYRHEHRHSSHASKGEHFEQSFQKVKVHLKDFAKEIKEDEHLGETFKDIKGRVRSFADEMAHSPDHRKRAFRDLIGTKHVSFFLGIAAFLFLINALTSFGRWWFPFPLVSIGLITYLHWLRTSFFSPEEEKKLHQKLLQKELARLDADLSDTEEGFARADRQAHARVRFYNHVYVYVGINAFLIVINLLTNPFQWWFLFPLIFWGFGLFMHWMKLTMRLPDKKRPR